MASRFLRAVAPLAVLGVLTAGSLVAAGHGDVTVIGPTPVAAAKVFTGVMTVPTITDKGKKSTLPVYYATSAKPRALVVIFHGHSHNGDEYPPQLRTIAKRDRVMAVAMRTREIKGNKGPFNSIDEEARGAASAIAAVREKYQRRLPTYLMCVSMGCAGAAYFIDATTRNKQSDRDARFVQKRFRGPVAGFVNVEGIANLVETWAEARAVVPDTADAIEYETRTGKGPANPTQNRAAYERRSLALLPPASYAELRIAKAVTIHGPNDGLVPYNQALEFRAAIVRAGVPYAGYTVLRDTATDCTAAHQTTATSYASEELNGPVCLAGHATETKPKTPVMRVAHQVLHDMLNGWFERGEHTAYPATGVFIS